MFIVAEQAVAEQDKTPMLSAALETAFDPAKTTACIGLYRAGRAEAAAWLPPGMAYAAKNGAVADPGHNGTVRPGGERR